MMLAQTQSSLNPQAPEFFPNYHNQEMAHVTCCVNYLHQCLQAPRILPFPNTNTASYYYSTSLPSPYLGYTHTCYPIVSPNHGPLVPLVTEPSPILAISEQTHLAQEPQMEPEEVVTNNPFSPSGVKRGGHRNRCLGSRSRGAFNGRRGGFTAHENQDAKKEWKAKLNGERDCEKKYFCKRNVRGAPKQNSPVVPVQPHGQNTTVMIRNIPNRYTRELLIEFLDNHCMLENQKAKLQNSDSMDESIVSAFDFLYLPVDFEKGANKGYAFVNFTDAKAAWKFHLAAHNQTWDRFQSNKIREIACARIQGKEELVRRFQNSTFDCESDMYLPVCFSPPRDGSRVMVNQRTMGRRVSNQI